MSDLRDKLTNPEDRSPEHVRDFLARPDDRSPEQIARDDIAKNIAKHGLTFQRSNEIFLTVEKILFRRAVDQKLNGYTIDTAIEISNAIVTLKAEDILRAGNSASLPTGYQWGLDAEDGFNLGKRMATEAILALCNSSLTET